MGTKLKITGYDNLNKIAVTQTFREHSVNGLGNPGQMTGSRLEHEVLESDVGGDEKRKKLLDELKTANTKC